MIRLEFEAAPRVLFDVMTFEESERLMDWLCSHPQYLELARRAIALGEEARAA